MKGDFVDLGAWELSQHGSHDEFLELCALSTSAELTEEEQTKLNQHLAACPACREVLQQYEAIVDEALPSIAASEDHANLDPGPRWSQKQAEKRLLNHLDENSKRKLEQTTTENGSIMPSGFGFRRLPPPAESAWSHMWALYAAAILIFAALSVFTYRVGMHRGSNIAKVSPVAITPAGAPDQTVLEGELSDASHERAIAHAQIAQRDRMIANFKHQLERQSQQIDQLKTQQTQLQAQVQTDNENKAELKTHQTELARRLEAAETNSHSLEQKLESLARESAQDAASAKASEAKVSELTKLLQNREAELDEQDQMLAHDRDIRELMGSRELYIAEVYDVGDSGETKKPYGRVFYTRGKSLIFYAYDLDQQAQLKRANSFQAWGRRGPDRQQAINLGIFYEDNSAKKRWIMKCDDPRTLAQIDGVFVTVEPNGGSRKPSDRTLLWAYLKVNANHP